MTRYAGKTSPEHKGKGEQFEIWKEGWFKDSKDEHMYLSADEFLRIYKDMTTTYKMYFGHYGPIRIPTDRRTQYYPEGENALPNDGFPRLTSEGLEILKEGLNGDFARWKVSIGNHPYELPYSEVRNFQVCATHEGDHFVAHCYTGLHYPQTTKNSVVIPWYSFDKVDENYGKEKVMLTRSDDFWFGLPILLGSYGECAT